MSYKTILAVAASMLATTISTFAANGEGTSLKDFYIETRLGYESEWNQGVHEKSNSLFKGQWLNIRLDGQITEGLTYSYRQRLNRTSTASFFDATDWIHLDWKATDRLSLSGGKQVVAIGGYEYDRAPIDLYYCSEFWNNIPCYQFGVSATYSVSGNDDLTFQFCNSPFRAWSGNDKYAYNLIWYGQHSFWQTIWSVNMLQMEDEFMNYISLGNRFNFTDSIRLDVDFLNRAGTSGHLFQNDWSAVTELSVSPCEGSRAFLKYAFDRNRSGLDSDCLIKDGTQINTASAGVEFSPLKQNRPALRLFAVAGYGWGENTNVDGTRRDGQLLVQAGIKWRLEILGVLKR